MQNHTRFSKTSWMWTPHSSILDRERSSPPPPPPGLRLLSMYSCILIKLICSTDTPLLADTWQTDRMVWKLLLKNYLSFSKNNHYLFSPFIIINQAQTIHPQTWTASSYVLCSSHSLERHISLIEYCIDVPLNSHMQPKFKEMCSNQKRGFIILTWDCMLITQLFIWVHTL